MDGYVFIMAVRRIGECNTFPIREREQHNLLQRRSGVRAQFYWYFDGCSALKTVRWNAGISAAFPAFRNLKRQWLINQKVVCWVWRVCMHVDVNCWLCFRVMFDDSIRAMAASTRIRKNQERIRELKLKAINALLDLPVGVGHSGTVDNESKEVWMTHWDYQKYDWI